MVLRKPDPIEEGPLRLEAVPDPVPGVGEVRVRVAACGVCHTDLHTVEGDLPAALPIVPGHQVVGVVDEVGPAGTPASPRGEPGDRYAVRPGVRVGIPWLFRACGRCAYCLSGDENLCERAEFTGLHRNGGYAEYVVAPAEFVVPLPDTFGDLEAAPLLCAGIIGYRSLKVCGLRPGERLAIFGFGSSAHIVIQVARHWGCDVLVFSRSERHRLMAERLGASWTGIAGEDPPFAADRAITFAPVGYLIPEALRILRRGGTLAVNAVRLDGVPAFTYERLYWEKTIRSVANATRRDAVEFMEVAADIPVKTEVRQYRLEDANLALLELKRGAVEGAAVLGVAAAPGIAG
jgi:propanol-preferring alcohol dehydrogenase